MKMLNNDTNSDLVIKKICNSVWDSVLNLAPSWHPTLDSIDSTVYLPVKEMIPESYRFLVLTGIR